MTPTDFPTALFYIFILPIVIFTLWQINTSLAPPREPPPLLREKRIVLLIAHPDDESMFFAPTLQKLTQPSLGNHVKILCLSTGDADGLGETRRKELEVAAVKLGLRKREDIYVVDDVRFRDGMKEVWDDKEIARVLAQAFAPDSTGAITSPSTTATTKTARKQKQTTANGPRATIDALITFDRHGVSSHPNHIALLRGAKTFLTQLMEGHSGYACPIVLYTLSSVNLLRKYSFVLDVLPTYITGIVEDIVQGVTGKKKVPARGVSKNRKGDRVMFVSNVSRYMVARDAMVRGHRSQMVWFRWGWVGIGRYMVINDLKREDI